MLHFLHAPILAFFWIYWLIKMEFNFKQKNDGQSFRKRVELYSVVLTKKNQTLISLGFYWGVLLAVELNDSESALNLCVKLPFTYTSPLFFQRRVLNTARFSQYNGKFEYLSVCIAYL